MLRAKGMLPAIMSSPRACRPLLGAVLLALCLCGCLTAPALLEPLGEVDPEVRALRPPWRGGLEEVETSLANGERLRGLWLEAEPGAPLILHLAGAAQSFTSTAQPTDALFLSLADLGFSSLAFDYRGVGASTGERSVSQLADDAQAMWAAALARAGGDPDRIVLRATSLGAVAVAELLERGARPHALLLHAPVEGRSVVRRYARDQLGWWAALPARLFKPVSRVRLAEALAAHPTPTYAMIPMEERWISEEEIEALLDAMRKARRATIERPGGDHMVSAMTSWSLRTYEDMFLEGLGLAPDQAAALDLEELAEDLALRLAEQPELLARARRVGSKVRNVPARRIVLAVLGSESVALAVEWVRLARMLLPDDLDPDLERAWFDLQDPHGALPVEAVLALGQVGLTLGRVQPGSLPATSFLGLTLSMAASQSEPRESSHVRFVARTQQGTVTLTIESEFIDQALLPPDAEPHDRLRRRARLMMKMSGIPDRVSYDAQGRALAAGLWDGTWWRFEASGQSGQRLAEPPPASSFALPPARVGF